MGTTPSLVTASGPDGKYTPLHGETPPSISQHRLLKNGGRNNSTRDMFLAFDEKTNVSGDVDRFFVLINCFVCLF